MSGSAIFAVLNTEKSIYIEMGSGWSIKFKPVSGWIAGKKEYVSKNKFKNQLRATYFVAYCPEFEKG